MSGQSRNAVVGTSNRRGGAKPRRRGGVKPKPCDFKLAACPLDGSGQPCFLHRHFHQHLSSASAYHRRRAKRASGGRSRGDNTTYEYKECQIRCAVDCELKHHVHDLIDVKEHKVDHVRMAEYVDATPEDAKERDRRRQDILDCGLFDIESESESPSSDFPAELSPRLDTEAYHRVISQQDTPGLTYTVTSRPESQTAVSSSPAHLEVPVQPESPRHVPAPAEASEASAEILYTPDFPLHTKTVRIFSQGEQVGLQNAMHPKDRPAAVTELKTGFASKGFANLNFLRKFAAPSRPDAATFRSIRQYFWAPTVRLDPFKNIYKGWRDAEVYSELLSELAGTAAANGPSVITLRQGTGEYELTSAFISRIYGYFTTPLHSKGNLTDRERSTRGYYWSRGGREGKYRDTVTHFLQEAYRKAVQRAHELPNPQRPRSGIETRPDFRPLGAVSAQ